MARNEPLEIVVDVDEQDIPIIECRQPLQVLVAGRRFRKSTLARTKGIIQAFSRPESEVMYLAPSYRRSLREYRQVMKIVKDHVSSHQRQPPPEIILDNGSRFSFCSFDRPDNLRGDPADLIIADEAAYLNGEEFWSAVQPMTAERDDSQIVLTSTVRDYRNWFYEAYRKALTDPHAKAWLYPTPSGLLFRGPKGRARLERIRSQIPEHVWRREYLCEPSDDAERAVFRHLDSALTDTVPPTGPEPGHYYIASFDLGAVIDNTTALVLDAKTGLFVYHYEFPLGMRHEEIARGCGVIATRWNAQPVADVTGGVSGGHSDSFVRLYRESIKNLQPFLWSGNSKDQSKTNVINHLAVELEFGRVKIPRTFTKPIEQLRAYQFFHKGDVVRYSAPSGQHDDFVSGAAQAAWALRKGWYSEPGRQFTATWM